MYLSKETNALLDKLKSSTGVEDICFIKACPYATKQTRLEKKICTLAPCELDLDSISVDNEFFYGKYGIELALYVPYDFGLPVAFDALERIVRAAMDDAVCGIKLSTVLKDSTTECYKVKAVLTFSLSYSREA